MKNTIIGRERELKLLNDIFKSNKAEFVAVYGRRRIGKTFLIDKVFGGKYDFYMTGMYEGTKKEQLTNFTHQLKQFSNSNIKRPEDWMDAFFMLQNYLESKLSKKHILIFIDELPWLDTHRSRFLKAFELFWNEWASKHDNIKLIVCGSATTWMTNKLLGDKGGLHNRVTQSIYLRPFNLAETENFIKSHGMSVGRMQVAEAYMALGGTPFYLDKLVKTESIAQNIDRLFFSEDAPLRTEYEFLLKSLFKESALYKKVVECLAKRQKGMTRLEIMREIKCDDSGYLSNILSDLCNCDFIRKYTAFGKQERNALYQLTDLYTLFYLRFVKQYNGSDNHYWSNRQQDITSWEGYAFEQLCLHHIPQIKSKLGISGVLTNVCSISWQEFVDRNGEKHKGGQIDLILDRGDNTINLCEIKFTNSKFSISTEYALRMQERKNDFCTLTDTKKSIHTTMITANGLTKNEGWQTIQSEITLDDLFSSNY